MMTLRAVSHAAQAQVIIQAFVTCYIHVAALRFCPGKWSLGENMHLAMRLLHALIQKGPDHQYYSSTS